MAADSLRAAVRHRRAAFVFWALWTLGGIFAAARFPTVVIDEAENANHAYNLAATGHAVFSLYDGLYPANLSYLRYAWPVVIRPFFVHPLAWFLRVSGFSLARARLFSVLVGSLCLGLVFDVGRRLRDDSLGLVAMALLGTRFAFLYATHIVRPEALLTLNGLLCFWFFLRGEGSHGPWWTAGAGLVAGMAPGIHTNGIVLIPALMLLMAGRGERRRLPAALLGAAVGFGWFLLSADWSLFRPGVDVLFFKEFASPPILKHGWDLFTPLVEETGRYFGTWQFMDWRGGDFFRTVFGWESLLAVAALVRACRHEGAVRRAGFFGLWIMIGFAYLVGQKAVNYLSLLAPWAALSLGDWLTSPESPVPLSDALFGLSVSLVLFPLGIFPLMLVPLFFLLLPRTLFQRAALVLLLCVFLNLPEARSWVSEIPSGFRVYWPISLLGLLLAGGTWAATRARSLKPIFSLGSWARGTTVAVAAATLVFSGTVAFSKPSFRGLCGSFAGEMAPGSRVAGPQALWLGLPSFEYRDIGALMWHRLLLNRRDLSGPLAAWKPDYVILDGPMAHRLRQGRPANGERLFPWPYHVVKEVDGGPAYGGKLWLVKMDWPTKKASS